MADFIIDNYIKDARAELDLYGDFTQALNLTSAFRQIGMIQSNKKATYAGIERTFKDKMASEGFVGALMLKASGQAKPPSDLFDDLQTQVETNLLDTHARFLVSSGTFKLPDPGDPLKNFKRDITTAGWNPKQLGIW